MQENKNNVQVIYTSIDKSIMKKTRKTMINKLVLAFIVMISCGAMAQQEPQYTQYMYNPSQINPAYSGSLGYATTFGLYRAQWIGLEGAPKRLILVFISQLKTLKWDME